MASRHRQIVKLLEKWPMDNSRPGAELTQYIRGRVASMQAASGTENEEWERNYRAVANITSNTHADLYPYTPEQNVSGIPQEDLREINTPQTQADILTSRLKLRDRAKLMLNTMLERLQKR